MLYVIYIIWSNTILPIVKATGVELINGLGPIIIICLGIAAMFGLSAVRRLAATAANGVLNVITVCIGAFFRALVAFLGWFFRLIPNTFSRVRDFWLDRGASSLFSTIMALIATVVVVAIIV